MIQQSNTIVNALILEAIYVSKDLFIHSCYNSFYTTFTNFSMKYLVMCKVYTNIGGIK